MTKTQVSVRNATFSDIDDIVAVEALSWSEENMADHSKWESRLNTFPQGVFVGLVNGKICGVVCAERVDYEFKDKDFTWYDITDNGYLVNSHNPNGRFLYGVDLSVSGGHVSKVSRLLLEAIADLVMELNLEGSFLGARIPSYFKHAAIVSPEEYVFGPWVYNGKERKLPYDPELLLYLKNGLEPLRVIPNYMEDPPSMNYGVLMLWRNPFHPNTSRGEAEAVLNSITNFFSSEETIYDPYQQATVSRTTLLLPGAGCEWYKKSGGCYMCGFNNSNMRYTHGVLLPSRVFNLIYDIGSKLVQKKRSSVLQIFNGGSFLSDNEIPLATQQYICRKVSSDTNLKRLFIESRSEFVTEDKVQRLLALMGDKTLEIAIGLECVTDEVRERHIHKGMSLESYEKAVRVCKDNGVKVMTYVFLKPIQLTEREAIEEAVKTIEYAFKVGSDTVALESAFVQLNTVMAEYYERGEFIPPNLWSIVEVVQRTKDCGPVYIGGFTDEPVPIAIPYGCDKCSERVYKALDEYRRTFDISCLDIEECTCNTL